MKIDKRPGSLTFKEDRRVTRPSFQNTLSQSADFGILDDISPEGLGQREAIQIGGGIRGVKNRKNPDIEYLDVRLGDPD